MVTLADIEAAAVSLSPAEKQELMLFLASRLRAEGAVLPEAYESLPGLLPHMHGDQEARYPKAVVEHEPGDVEPEENTVLEQRGVALGQRSPRPPAQAPAQLPAV